MKKEMLAAMLSGVIFFAAAAVNVAAEEMKLELKAGTTMQEVLAENTGKRVAQAGIWRGN